MFNANLASLIERFKIIGLGFYYFLVRKRNKKFENGVTILPSEKPMSVTCFIRVI